MKKRFWAGVVFLLFLLLNATVTTGASFAKPWIIEPLQVTQRLDRISTQGAVIYGRTQSAVALKEFLQAQGLIALPTVTAHGGANETLTTQPANVSMEAPWVYYDRATGYYMVYGQMIWNRDWGGQPYWRRDIVWCWDTCKLGGLDAVGLYVDNAQGLLNRGYRLHTYDARGEMQTYKTATDNNNAGVAFTYQDEYWQDSVVSGGYNYSSHSYLIELRLQNVGKAENVGIKHKYAHTWASTSIQSISVSTGGLGISFSSSGDRWEVTSTIVYW